MAIKDVTDILRWPRIDKIHLGLPMEGRNYPQSTDYFVCPQGVIDALGEDKPKSLTIMFPTEEPDQFAPAWYKAFSKSRGLVCKGDGVTAGRKVNMAKILGANGVMQDIPNDAAHWPIVDSEAKGEDIRIHDIECLGTQCPQYLNKDCRRMMMLQFMLPDVPGLGIYQIDTGSINGILNIYGAIELIRSVAGRVSMIPLTLNIGPQKTINPDTQRAQTNNIMTLTCDFSLAKLQEYNRLGPVPDMSTKALPEPDDEVPTDLIDADATDIVQQPTEQAEPTPPAAEQAPEPMPDPAPAEAAPVRKPRSDKKLTAADKESLLTQVRATGMGKEDWQAAYKEMGLQHWDNINEGDKAKILECLSIYTKAHEAPPAEAEEGADPHPTDAERKAIWERMERAKITEQALIDVMNSMEIPGFVEANRADLTRLVEWLDSYEKAAEAEEASPPDLGGEEEIATAGEVKDFEVKAEAAGLIYPMRRDWMIMKAIPVDVLPTKTQLAEMIAWVETFEDGSEGKKQEEATPDGEQTEEHEAESGQANSAAIASQQEEKGGDTETGGTGGSGVPPEPSEASGASQLTLCRAWSEDELDMVFDDDAHFLTTVMGHMSWEDYEKMGGGNLDESFKRRVRRIKELAIQV